MGKSRIYETKVAKCVLDEIPDLRKEGDVYLAATARIWADLERLHLRGDVFFNQLIEERRIIVWCNAPNNRILYLLEDTESVCCCFFVLGPNENRTVLRVLRVFKKTSLQEVEAQVRKKLLEDLQENY